MTEQEQTEETFQDLGLSPEIQQAIDGSALQTRADPGQKPSPSSSRARRDRQAQTGTGKTAAFRLPMLQYLDPAKRRVQANRPHPDP